MNNTGLEGKDVEYEVVLRFRRGGPAIVGAWSEFETADRKFRSGSGRGARLMPFSLSPPSSTEWCTR
ncbi:hypothetical protein [Streptomyces roseolus]